MLQRRTTGSRVLEYGGSDDQMEIASARPAGASIAGRSVGFLQIIWARKWMLLVCAIVGVAAGVAYLSQATNIYSAVTQIYIQQTTGTNQLFIGATTGGGLNYLQTQAEVIRSTTVVALALDRPEARQARSVENSDNAIALVRSSLNATVGRNTDVISITAESPYPEDAAIFANAVRDAYIDYEKQMHRSTAADIVNVLEKEKQREDAEFKQINEQMLDFRKKYGIISLDGDKGNIILEKLAGLSSALTTAQIEGMQTQVAAESADAFASNPAKMQSLMLTNHIQGIDGGNVLRAEISQYEATLLDLKSNYGPNYPAAMTLERRLERLRAQAADADGQAVAGYLAVLHQQAAASKRKIDELQAAYDAQQKLAMDLNVKAAEYSQLQMGLQRNERVVDYLNERIKEFHLTAQNDEPNTINTLEFAKPSNSPVRPNRPQILAISLAVGLMAGLGGALLLDWMDHRIRSAADVEAILGLSILGAVPHMMGKRSAAERGQEIHLYPKSEVAEAYRTIRTGIRFGITDASSRTLLVTSPSPGDGKTTVASNLAIAIAQTGKRVLLVDADCRRPMIHRVYGTKEDHGLASVLAGQSDLASAIHHSSTENLDIMPCGPVPPNPAEMLNSEVFTTLLRDLASQYDQVVVDSPPVAPVTDARILAAACDATVLVIRAEKTGRRVAEHARDALASVGAAVLGVVVNDAPRGRTAGSNYGHYHYGYGYTYGNSRSKEVKAISVGSATP
jgi:succinoglycan biosynthesis transport protein ExoP